MRVAAQLRTSWREPLQVLSAFAGEPWAVGFLSGGRGPRARWSYLARRPDAVLTLGADDRRDPFKMLAEMLGPPGETARDGPPFQGGLAGLASYELGDRVEVLGLARSSDWPDLAVGLYSSVLAFDHQERQVIAVGRGYDEADSEQAAFEAMSWLQDLARPAMRGPLTQGLTASDAPAYEAAVAQVVARIHAGEIFQANIARSWTGRLTPGATPFDLLARLAGQSAAPFAAYQRLAGRAVVSNSPERFLQVDAAGDAETRPIKGTRPRGVDARADAALSAELAGSLKDRAENLMIVDLMRNDLARVCAPGSVKVPELFSVESFTNVHHLVSTVRGRLAAGNSAIDLLKAAFPPGSITGAPKVQAMKLIAQLESPRGPYCGSLFWAGADGAFDSSVLIRTAACVQDEAGWRIEARAGAGIVADSDPRAERIETEDKIAALLRALEGAP
ncbi:anthranilate synthase component I family protein [Phenylobacterium sp. 20VBR1]|uniref:Anthranilate synthase component I family protein n=1 Tax=Phenylobacterium glaciei TaxID=2803784 RepID=A0A941HYN6_9CAUL|nr:anthranilate synthase component I family protein [Phenylobacterium glaciei]MBR7621587.1 anthranilate synthase component I family protein [Phenylobacterium glaciei]